MSPIFSIKLAAKIVSIHQLYLSFLIRLKSNLFLAMSSLLTFCTLFVTFIVVVFANQTTTKKKESAYETYRVEKVTPPSSRGSVATNEEKAVKPVTHNSVYITSGINSDAFPDQKYMPNDYSTASDIDDDDDDDYDDDDDDDGDDDDDVDDFINNLLTTMKPKGIAETKNNSASIDNSSVFDASQLPGEYAELNLKDKAVSTKVSRIYSVIFKNIIQKLVQAKTSDSFTLDKDVLAAFEKPKKKKAVLKTNNNNAKNEISSSADILLVFGAKVTGKDKAKTEKSFHYLALVNSSPLDESLQLKGDDGGDGEKLTYKLTDLKKVTVAKLHK